MILLWLKFKPLNQQLALFQSGLFLRVNHLRKFTFQIDQQSIFRILNSPQFFLEPRILLE